MVVPLLEAEDPLILYSFYILIIPIPAFKNECFCFIPLFTATEVPLGFGILFLTGVLNL